MSLVSEIKCDLVCVFDAPFTNSNLSIVWDRKFGFCIESCAGTLRERFVEGAASYFGSCENADRVGFEVLEVGVSAGAPCWPQKN